MLINYFGSNGGLSWPNGPVVGQQGLLPKLNLLQVSREFDFEHWDS